MFVHELVHQLPDRFAAIASECGGKPHEGWVKPLPIGSAPVSWVLIAGNTDTTIPPRPPQNEEEKKSWDGYLYATNETVLAAYVQHNQCQLAPARLYETNYTGNDMVCMEVGYDCHGGASVTSCIFNGGHDINRGVSANTIPDGPQFSWSFFKAHPVTRRLAEPVFFP